MKYKVYNQQISICLLANYFVFTVIGYYFAKIYGSFLGLTLAYLLDRFFPRWAYDLTWKEIKRAIQNHYEHGCNGSRLIFRIGHRKLHLYRDNRGNPYRIGIIIPTKEWAPILGEKGMEMLYIKYGGMTITSPSSFKKEILYFPDDEFDQCIEILSLFIKKAEGGLNPTISARSNCATKNIWAS